MKSVNFLKWIVTYLQFGLFIIIITIPTISNAQRVTTVAGGSGDGGQALVADLFDPTTVAVDATGNVFIADAASSTIRNVNVATGLITSIAGNGATGGSGDGGLAINAQLGDPSGVAVDANGNLYVADQLYSVHRSNHH